MRLASVTRDFESTLDVPQRGFTIAASAKMFHILSDSLYKHKELAIVRELTANAYDAHIAANQSAVPFELHLPTPLEPYFKIKDYGTGLPEEGIYELYTRYGGSNKTGSNDFVGGFGLGSKSPFAYTDQFSVESRYGGKLLRFQAYMDSQGMPTVAKIDEAETDEPNGLTVEVPVAAQNNSYRAFADAAARVLPFVPVPYKVNALPSDLAAGINPPKYIGEIDAGAGITAKLKTSGGCSVVMGIVAYPLDRDAFEYNSAEFLALSQMHFDIYAPIGAFDIAASREALSYSQQTKQALNKLLPALILPMCEESKRAINEADDLFEGYARYRATLYGVQQLLRQYIQQNDITDDSNPVFQMYDWFTNNPTWKGQSFKLTIPPDIIIRRIATSGSRRSRKPRVDVLCDGTGTNTLHVGDLRAIKDLPIYWKDTHGAPFTAFFETDPSAQVPAFFISGDKTLLTKLFAFWGLDFGAVAIDLPHVVRKSKPRSVYGSHRYEAYNADEYAHGHRIPAQKLAQEGNALVIHDSYSTKQRFTAILARCIELGVASVDNALTHAIVPAAHGRVAGALIKAGASASIADFLTRGPVTVNKDVVLYQLALARMDVAPLHAACNTWPLWRAFPGSIRDKLFERLEQEGLDELALFFSRYPILDRAAPAPEVVDAMMSPALFTDAEIQTEIDRLYALASCQQTMANEFLKRYSVATPGTTESNILMWAGGTWTAFHEMLIHYLKTN